MGGVLPCPEKPRGKRRANNNSSDQIDENLKGSAQEEKELAWTRARRKLKFFRYAQQARLDSSRRGWCETRNSCDQKRWLLALPGQEGRRRALELLRPTPAGGSGGIPGDPISQVSKAARVLRRCSMGRTGIGATAKVGVSFALLRSKIAQFREDFQAATSEPRSCRRKQREFTQKATKGTKRRGDQLGGTGQTLPLHVFLDMLRRIAQERVPTASNVGSRDVTWASQPTPLIPFRVFSRVSRAPFLRQNGDTDRTTGSSCPLRQKQTGGQNTDRHLQRAELTREFRFPFSDFGENHDHRDRRASLCDRRHVKVRYRRSDLDALPGDELH
jgi:hypothetical protein